MYLANLIARTAGLWPDGASLCHAGRKFTWAQTYERILRLADAIRETCGKSGRAVVILGDSGIEYYELSFAVAMAGQMMVPMNSRLSPQEYRQLLAQLDCALAFVGDGYRSVIGESLDEMSCPIVGWRDGQGEVPATYEYEAFLGSGKPAAPSEVAGEDIWAIIYTGGTTGLPKGVLLSHRAIAYNIATVCQTLPWEERCRFLQVSPLFHLAGLGPSYAVTALGGTHFFLPQFSVEDLLSKLSEHRCTCTNLVPTMINWMLAREDLDSYNLSALRHLAYGASAISLPTLERLLAKFPELTFSQFYGQTESGGGLTALTWRDHNIAESGIARLPSAGRPSLGAIVRILDEEGNELPRGEWGEICGRSEGLFSGYAGHPELTANTIRDGWLHTGDVGFMDKDGYVFVTDRLKDMIVTGGENVSSSEVEAILGRFPGILQCAVVAVQDEVWGERIHACVVRAADCEASAEDIQEFCRTRIARYKCPRSFTFFSEPLPVSAVGKVRKDVLREMIAAAEAGSHARVA